MKSKISAIGRRKTNPWFRCFCALVFGLLILAGCAVGPDYKRPDVKSPTAFRDQRDVSTNSFADLPWWQVFQDETLQKLVKTALTNNYDLRIAFSRVEQAKELEREARSEFFPMINYEALGGRGKNVSGNAPSPTGVSGSVFGGDVNASWEIDLWGRIRRLTESARAQYFATKEARRDVRISVISQVAQDYFQLLALERELVIARDTTNSFGQSLKIFTARLNGGVSSRLETSSAEALMASAAATIPDLERQIALEENQISVLLGQNPGPIEHTSNSLESHLLPDVPVGLPSALLERRPDVRESEQMLRSANAQVGVAKAGFFPQLDLTGLFGRVGPELSAFTGGGATAWEVAAGLTGPIFEGGRLRAEYRRSKEFREQSVLQYESTILNAMEEVANALISREKLVATRVEQAHAVEAYQDAVKIAMKRYQLGTANYYEVLQEQQLLFPAQNILVQTEVSQLLNMVQLYQALGGGWQTNSAR